MKVLQVEFNELSPQLLADFMAAGSLPNFRRFYETSQVFTTDAHAEPPNLEPWIQWPTVHLGVSHLEHGLRHLGATPADIGPSYFVVNAIILAFGVGMNRLGARMAARRRSTSPA